MSTLSKAERDKLPASAFCDPARRLFPILDASDVRGAASLLGKAQNADAVKACVIRKAKANGWPIPDAWKTADHSAGSVSVADFSADTVCRRGKVWEAGEYPDRDFAMTPEELLAAVADFQPVPVTIEHLPTVLDGKLGVMARFTQDEANPYDGIGELELPRWLSEVLPDPVPVSLSWNRESKRVEAVGIVVDPRIADAAVAAFSKQSSAPAEFHDSKRFKQKVHDLAASAGAACAPAASFSDRKERRMSFKDTLRAWFSAGMPDDFDPGQPSAPAPVPQPSPQPDPETAALRERVAAFEKREEARIEADAIAFAKGEVDAKRILPAAEQEAKERYLRAARDDAQLGAVTFSTGQTTRVAQLRADYAARAPHKLTQELAGSGQQPAAVLFNQTGSEMDGLVKQAEEVARAYAKQANRGGK